MSALRRIGIVIVVLGVLTALLIWSLPTTIPFALALFGMDDVRIGAVDIGLRRARIDRLTIGSPPKQSVETIEIDYSWDSVRKGGVDRARIDGLVVRAAYRDGALIVDDGPAPVTGDDGDDGAFSLDLPIACETLLIENGRIDVETPIGAVSLPVDAQLAIVDGSLTVDLAVAPAVLDARDGGAVAADLRLSGAIPRADAPTISQLAATGELTLEGRDLAWLDGIAPVAVDASLALDLEDGRLTVAGPIDATGQNGAVKGQVSAGFDIDDRLRPTAIDDGRADFDLTGLALDGFRLDRGTVAARLDGAPGDLRGGLGLDLDGMSVTQPGIEMKGVKLKRDFDLVMDERTIELAARTDGDKIGVDGVTIGEAGEPVIESGWFTIQWPGREQPWLTLDLAEQRFSLDWALVIDPVRIDLAGRRFWARIEDLSVSLAGHAGGLGDGSVRIRQGRADLPGANLALAGIESDLAIQHGALATGSPIPLVIRAVRPLDEPRLFAPLRLEAGIDVQTSAVSVDGSLATRSSPKAALAFSGWHDVETGEGLLDVELPKLNFTAGQLQPKDLSPMVDGLITGAEGGIALDGRVVWQDGRLSSDLQLLIEELGFAIGPARLARINSVIRIDGLAPPTTPERQLLSVGLLDVGLPLTDGLVSMQLRPDGHLAVDQLAWRLADGRITSEPFTFGSDVDAITLMLKADGLDLDTLLGLTPLDDLSGEGSIDGTLPLRIGETAAIDGGVLAAEGPGVLRYAPDDVPGVLQAGGESVRLMLQALENFRYEALKITLDGQTDGDTAIGLHLKGANPDLYEGHPVEFNLNLEGNLASLIQTNLDNYQIPDRIRERLQGFER